MKSIGGMNSITTTTKTRQSMLVLTFLVVVVFLQDNTITTVNAFTPITPLTSNNNNNNNIQRAALTLIDVLAAKEHRSWILKAAGGTTNGQSQSQQSPDSSNSLLTTPTNIVSSTQLNAVTVKDNDQKDEITTTAEQQRLKIDGIANVTTDTDNSTTITTTTTEKDDVVISPISDMDMERVLMEVEREAELVVNEMMDEGCEYDPLTGGPLDVELCTDETVRIGFRSTMKNYIQKSLQIVRGKDEDTVVSASDEIYNDDDDMEEVPKGELLERGWEQRAASSALRRNAEVWKFALKAVFRVLKPRKMRSSGTATEEEIRLAQIEAATFIRDGLLRLGPSFVKLGQVISTRTDVLPATYTDILRTLTDEVPGFSGKRAKEIIRNELGVDCDKIFQNFSPNPLKAASLGQVHTAMYKGKKVAIKVQRAGLKELFDTDLKNLKKLAVLLEKFDPKSDGADRDWVKIYDESERLLYLEIDYLNEAKNTERFAKDFKSIDYVRVPNVYPEVTTPRVLVMEFVESIKMTDSMAVTKAGVDRKLLAKRIADSFLRQIVETSYFHCDPHSGNLCCNKEGQLVFYDFGQMDELKPNVREGLRTFCTALFKGGPTISDTELAINAKELVKGVEQAGVLSKGADRLSVEKLARFFMRTFKDKQLGKSGGNIKETLGADLQTLTDNNSFRFPATFTFVFRAFVSIEGIGKELDPEFDLGKLAQPFIQKFIDEQKGYGSPAEKNLDIFTRATGLNFPDINTAVSQPRKVAYIEETIRAMENGSLKIRVRSLENEKALERLNLRYDVLQGLMMSTIVFNIANLLKSYNPYVRTISVTVATALFLQSLVGTTKLKAFDKKQAKYVNSDFVDEPVETKNNEK